MEGIILVDKPEGWTSFDVVAKIRGMVRGITRKNHEARGYCLEQINKRALPIHCKCKVKVGHTGTLDPAATGLLMLCVGKATKQVPELIKQDKTYEVELTLGQTSTTGDKEGEISEVSGEVPDSETVTNVISSFVGEIVQIPPIYSAIKIDGKRAYELARAGKEVVMAPRKVTIYFIEQVEYDYPKVLFTTRVGSGTYIRSLSVDIGEKLETGAYMSNLRRTSIGDSSIEQAYAISDINPELLQKILDTNR